MNNIKQISMVALFLLIVGTVGSILTFKTMIESNDVSEEKVINDDHFSNIEVTSYNTRIEMIATNNSTTTVELSGKISKQKKYSLDAGVEGNTLSIHLNEKQKKLFNFDFLSTSLSLKVYVPEKLYDSIKLKSNNGRVQAEKLKAKDITAETNNGRIELTNIESSTITTEADNGRIDLKRVVASSVKVKADNGRILLDDVEGEISGKANNGSIKLITNHLDRSIELETDNGRIEIQTEKEPTNATIDVSVHNGRVDIFGNSNRGTVFGNGENHIKLTSHNGSITVRK